MRPVNLLPAHLRPRERKATGSGGYIVLGVLGALLIATVMYVVTANQVTSRQAETQDLKTETEAAEQRAGALAQFGAFQEMKVTRMASVSQLAAGRFDWERMARELARVLPAGVWVTELEATAIGDEAPSGGAGSAGSAGSSGSSNSSSSGSSSGSGSGGAAAGGASGSAGGAGGTEGSGPSLTLTGCAPSQEGVAETMVRLRRLHQAQDVELVSSAREEEAGATGATGAAPSASSPSSGGATAAAPASTGPEGCGAKRGRQNYKFEVSVKLAPIPDSTLGGGRVPRSLGGGS